MSAPAVAAPNPIDFATLDQLREQTGDDTGELICELVDAFQVEGEGGLAALRAAVGQGDPEAMAKAAHRLKSSAANLGARTMADLCASIENAGDDGRMDGSAASVDALEAEYKSAAEGLRSYVAKLT